MNRKINKTMAEAAAEKMACAAFDKQIKLATIKRNEYVEKLTRKYVPNVVRSVVAEFPSYFEKCKFASITTLCESSSGYMCNEQYIGGELSFYIPGGCQYIKAANIEYKELRKLHKRIEDLFKNKKNLKQQIYDALCALKTEKKVKESLPEALPYIEFPEEVQLPAPMFGTLRQIIRTSIPEAK